MMADGLIIEDDLNAGGGYRQTISDFWVDDVGGSTAATEMTRLAAGTEAPKRWIATRDGSVTAVCVKGNTPRTAGTLTITVYKNGVATGLTAVLNAIDTTFAVGLATKDDIPFAAGDELSLYYETSSFTPTTLDCRANLEVEL